MSNRFLLPSNATAQEVALAGSSARVSAVQIPTRSLYNPDTCSSALLPWLAWAYSVDEWNPAWTEAQKRDSVRSSIFVHRHKGTIGAVKRALKALGVGVQVQEWFSQIPAGAPYTYRLLLDISQVGVGTVNLQQVHDVVNATKNVRSHLSEILVTTNSIAGPTVASVCSIGSEITLKYGALIADGTVTANGMYRANGIRTAA